MIISGESRNLFPFYTIFISTLVEISLFYSKNSFQNPCNTPRCCRELLVNPFQQGLTLTTPQTSTSTTQLICAVKNLDAYIENPKNQPGFKSYFFFFRFDFRDFFFLVDPILSFTRSISPST